LASALAPLLEGANPTLRAGDLPMAERVAFTSTEDQVVHAFFYAPKNADVHANDALPPLLVIAHGGPTGVTSPIPSMMILQFTTRGFAVLDVNYRGSTGLGRNYRERLRHAWGEVDVDDCVAGARAMAARGKVDGTRMLIRGGSAGGYTLLMALLRHPGVFSAATSLYGVSDPRSLTDDTHKFESGYASYLFGDGPTREHAFQTRSPILSVDAITTPVLFLQGADDKVVTPDQSTRMHEALKARGVMTELAVYEGEGHGFRQAGTLRDVFERELAFYARVFASIKCA
jgi:dipeptidyl aminopeptidase/acylaminoacyl peptidase